MKLEAIEIENFRSISSKVTLSEKQSTFLSIVGANNLGKSNILRAINLFFNGEVEAGVRFDPKTDIHQGESSSKIAITFRFDKTKDRPIAKYIDDNHAADFKDYVVPITLLLAGNGRVVYSFSGEKGQRKNLPELRERISAYVNCIYIPAIKDYRALLDSQMMRKIVAATFQGWGRGVKSSTTIGEQKEKFRRLLKDIQVLLDESGDYVSDIVHSVVPNITKFSFSLPYDNLEDFLGRLVFTIKEEHLKENVGLANVGSGVQSFTIFSMLKLLHEIRPTNTYKKASFLWLIEEPETFMHHDLQRKLFEKLKEYSADGHIIISTHSPVFIQKEGYGDSYIVERAKSTTVRPITPKAMLSVISGNLGVDFADFLDFKRYNVLVEGETDKVLLLGLNKILLENGKPILDETLVDFLVCGSANGIPHFWGMYNVFNKYADFVALFDRDDAGIKARSDLKDKKVAEDLLLLIPESTHKANCEIEDLVEKTVWDKVVRLLDEKHGLITVQNKQKTIVGYTYEQRHRIDVKRLFTKHLLEEAATDASAFSLYVTLLKVIRGRFMPAK